MYLLLFSLLLVTYLVDMALFREGAVSRIEDGIKKFSENVEEPKRGSKSHRMLTSLMIRDLVLMNVDLIQLN